MPFDTIRSNYDFEQQALAQPGAHCLADLQQVPVVEQHALLLHLVLLHLLLLQLLLQPVIRPKAKINDASKPSFFMSLILSKCLRLLL
jgi:hypothetical protein